MRSDIAPHPMHSLSYYSILLSLELLVILLSYLLPQLECKLQNQGCSCLILCPRAWLEPRGHSKNIYQMSELHGAIDAQSEGTLIFTVSGELPCMPPQPQIALLWRQGAHSC